ncbi:MAG: NADH-quinone oxidoreductase subunit H [Bacteroidales bacterium]|jgi:NADH-quinone oxidoreductase subunit H|nr:NADH-quinone oxidoreductase subunit H [Bacteroidales bacterium]
MGEKILFALISLFLTINYGFLMNGVIRKIYARVGRRHGIPFYQMYIDLIKTLALRTNIRHGTMFYLGPVFRFAGGVGLFLFTPVVFGSAMFGNLSFSGDVLLLLSFQFFGTLGMALGAGESGHPNAAIGVTRGLAQMTAVEVPFVLALMGVAIQYDSLSLHDIVAAQQGGIMHWTLFTNPFIVAAGMLALLGSFMRPPFDVVLAGQEIPIGPPTEYHSNYMALMLSNRAIFPMAKAILFMNLFFGGANTYWEMMIKTFAVVMWSVFVGVSFPRFRVEQSIRWFLRVPLILGILGIVYVQFFMS